MLNQAPGMQVYAIFYFIFPGLRYVAIHYSKDSVPSFALQLEKKKKKPVGENAARIREFSLPTAKRCSYDDRIL